MMRKNATKKIIVMRKNTSKNNYDEEKCYKKMRMRNNATKN